MTTTQLPSVAGRHLTTSLAEFERRCLVLIDEEQRKLSPDNALIGALCDAVRVSREYTDATQIPISFDTKIADAGGVMEYAWRFRALWQDRDDAFWLARLREEVQELDDALAGKHEHTPDDELRQVGSICINWLLRRKRSGLRSGDGGTDGDS